MYVEYIHIIIVVIITIIVLRWIFEKWHVRITFCGNGSTSRLKAGFGISNLEIPGFTTLLDISLRGIQQVCSIVPYVRF